MFSIVLLLLFRGMSEPIALVPGHEPPFVSRSACDEWRAQETRRIERVLATMAPDKRPEQWEIKCVPVGPFIEARAR